MEIVGEVLNPVDLLVAVREREADAGDSGLQDSEEPGLTSHLLAEYPGLTIFALAANGGFIRPGRREIAEPSEADILGALRQAIRVEGNREE